MKHSPLTWLFSLGWVQVPGWLFAGTPWFFAAIGAVSGTIGLIGFIAERSERRAAPKFETLPSTWGTPGLLTGVWCQYHEDRISLVSALLRVEQLFAARVAEITDWQTIDWTTSPLEPLKGRWEWDGDRLVEKPPPTPSSLDDQAASYMRAVSGVPPHYVGCRCGRAMSSDGMCRTCRPQTLAEWQRERYRESLRVFGLLSSTDLRAGLPAPPPKPSDVARSAIPPAFRTEPLG